MVDEKELLTNSITSSFCLIMALFFFGSDAVIAIILEKHFGVELKWQE